MMLRICSIVLTLLFFLDFAYAQNPLITISGFDNPCLNTILKIPVAVTGKFNPDNKFVVEIKKDYYSDEIIQLESIFKDGYVEVVFRDSSLTKTSDIYLRVVGTSPGVQSAWSRSVQIYSKGNITVSKMLNDTLNSYDDFAIKFSGYTTSDFKITLIDSSIFSYSGNNSYSTFLKTENVYPEKSTVYTIAHAENHCGEMAVSGQAAAVVNSISLRTSSISPISACLGSEIQVNFSSSGGSFTGQTKFKVRFLEALYSGEYKPGGLKFETDARLSGNILIAKIPENLVISEISKFGVQILTTSPQITGNPGDALVSIVPKPKASFVYSAKTINMGEGVYIPIKYIGGGAPYKIMINDGSEIFGDEYLGENWTGEFFESPMVTTEYSIKSISSVCGEQLNSSTGSVKITVLPGLKLNDVEKNMKICEGQTMRLPFTSNVDLSSATSFKMEFTNANNVKISVPATRDGEFIEFKVPGFSKQQMGNSSRNESFSFRLTSANPVLASPSANGMTILSVPDLTWVAANQTVFNVPSQPVIYFQLSGGGPYLMEDQDGKDTTPQINQDYGSFPVFVPKSTSFSVKSVSNLCFKNEKLPEINFTVKNPASTTPFISVIPLEITFCNTDSVELTLNSSGKFADGNIFNVEITNSSSCCEFNTAVSSVYRSGKIRFKLPDNFPKGNISDGTSFFHLRIASTNPVIYTETVWLRVRYLLGHLSLDFKSPTSKNGKFTANDKVSAIFSFLGGEPLSLVYSDGAKDIDLQTPFASYSGDIPIANAVGTSTYTIKSVTTICGMQQVNVAKSVTIMPFRISFPSNFDNPYVCIGNTLKVPFVIQDGDGTSASFILQIAKGDLSDFQNVSAPVTSHEISFMIPQGYPGGDYTMRIVSDNGAISNEMKFRIGVPPVATLTTSDSIAVNPITVNPGDRLNFQIDLKGTLPQWIVADGFGKRNLSSSPFTYQIIPQIGQDVKLRFASNVCGMGEVSGVFKVKVSPAIQVSIRQDYNCAGGFIDVNYEMQGDFDLRNGYIVFELESDTGAKIKLDSTQTASGLRKIKLPSSLVPGTYTVRTTVPKYELKKEIRLFIESVPNIILTGNTVINNGDKTNLIVTAQSYSTGDQIYTLSDGTTGTYYENSNPGGYPISVSPSKTTTYAITAISNRCGAGSASGSATVEVNPLSERSTVVTNVLPDQFGAGYCTGDSISVEFGTKGVFSNGNKFSVQLSDSTGKNFKSIPSTGNSSPLKATLTADIKGYNYRIRVVASDQGTASGAYEKPLTIMKRAKARFASDYLTFNPSQLAPVIVLLEGGGPWSYVIGNEVFNREVYTASSPDTILINQPTATSSYSLSRVSNGCGYGTIEAPDRIRVEVITGNEPSIPSFKISVAPNPAREIVTIKLEKSGKYNVSLYNSTGMLLTSRSSVENIENIDIRKFLPGIYILKVEMFGVTQVFKIIKE